MRIATTTALFVALLAALGGDDLPFVAEGKNPSRSAGAAPSRRGGSGGGSSSRGGGGGGRPKPSRSPRRRAYEDEYDEEDEEDGVGFGFPEDSEEEEREDSDALYDDDEEEEYEEEEVLRPIPSKKRGGRSSGGGGGGRRGPPPSPPSRRGSGRGPPSRGGRGGPPPPPQRQSRRKQARYDDEYDEDEYDDYAPRGRERRPAAPPSRGGRGGRAGGAPPSRGRGGRGGRGGRSGGGSVVPYTNKPQGTFTRGIAALRESIPDPTVVKEGLAAAASATRDRTSKLSSTIYREVKGLTSSELEQVMLKATRPDDTAVKGKHVERLVGVTYQISARYDIYDSVLRKLWNKMAERDWRTTTKSLYVLHRFSADGAPEHQPALKARLRELRRTRDPKRKDKYFNSKQLLAGDSTPETIKFRAFMARYAHYVLLRAQCFGGMFNEISQEPPPPSSKSSSRSSSKPQKPITSTSLRAEHLEAAQMLLKAGCACALKDGEECENTAIAVERVASDLIGLTTAVATALNRALKGKEGKGADPALIKRWCEFYSEELLPQTKGMVKKTSAKLDAYGLFLPSRMGASVSQEVLKKGLQGPEEDKASTESAEVAVEEAKGELGDDSEADEGKDAAASKKQEDEARDESEEEEEEEEPEEGDEYDEYDYEEEEYYDDEEA